MPHSSLSVIWQANGCQHTLQPTQDDFAPPTVPALTMRGFSRWESLEILLGPDEHVPFMQYAVKNWNLKHPETGEPFPPDLPAHVFPAEADMEVDRWHKSCAAKLRSEAASSSAEDAPPPHAPDAAPHPEPGFTYVRPNPFQPASPRTRPVDGDYFEQPIPYFHIPAWHAAQRPRPHRGDRGQRRMRRRSFSDYASAPPDDEPPWSGASPDHLDPRSAKEPTQPRRHSHPRRLSSGSSDSDSVPVRILPNPKRRRHPASPPPPSFRHFVPPAASGPPPFAAQGVPASFRPRSDMRSDEAKRRNVPSPFDTLRNKLSETVSNILPNGLTSDRPRPGSRQNSVNNASHARRSCEPYHPSRLSHSYSDLDSDASSDGGARRRRRTRDEHERERLRRGRARDADWDREDDRASGVGRERARARRPDTQRRTSSHVDIDRQRDAAGWDPRDRDRARDERRQREVRSPDQPIGPPPTGVTGRRYPEHPYG